LCAIIGQRIHETRSFPWEINKGGSVKSFRQRIKRGGKGQPAHLRGRKPKKKRPGAKEIECLVEWEKGELARDAGWDGSWIGWLFLAKSNAAFFGSVVHVITNGACAIFRLA